MSSDVKAPDGWLPTVGEGWLEGLQRRYSADQEVSVWILPAQSGYAVQERASWLTPDPDGTAVGARESVELARELMLKTCRDWDSWLVNRPATGCSA